MFKYLLILIMLLLTLNAMAIDYRRHLGIGTSTQLANDIPAISLKLQQTRSFALGTLFNMSTSDTRGGYAAAVKAYQIIYDEPQLNFYFAALGGLIKTSTLNEDTRGFQFDFTLGTEFHFQGLNSLGFSMETGMSLHKQDEFVVETAGYNFITASIHFYL